jgi:hypothetical protein
VFADEIVDSCASARQNQVPLGLRFVGVAEEEACHNRAVLPWEDATVRVGWETVASVTRIEEDTDFEGEPRGEEVHGRSMNRVEQPGTVETNELHTAAGDTETLVASRWTCRRASKRCRHCR